MSNLQCPNDQQLEEYLLGKLEEAFAEGLIVHVAYCENCSQRLDALERADVEDEVLLSLRTDSSCKFEGEAACHAVLGRLEQIGSAASDPAEVVRIPELEIGSQFGQYELRVLIHCGRMGTVYEAFHTKLKRRVALKILPSHRTIDERAIKRFHKEMAAVGRLEHANVVRASDAGELNNIQYLVMDYVDGLNFATLVRRAGRLPVASVLQLIRQAALGLDYAHENGLIHRDIKPSNLMLDRRGQVKVLDLGLARYVKAADDSFPASSTASPLADTEEFDRDVTQVGQLVGTTDYMSPEQANDVRQVDRRADIYSLGCTLYFLLTGRVLFKRDTAAATLESHRHDPVPLLSSFRDDVPDELNTLFARMVAKNPDDRYATMVELTKDIDACPRPTCELLDAVIDIEPRQLLQNIVCQNQTRAESGPTRQFAWPLFSMLVVFLAAQIGMAWWWMSPPDLAEKTIEPTIRNARQRDDSLVLSPSFLSGLREIGLANQPRHTPLILEEADGLIEGSICFSSNGQRIAGLLGESTLALWNRSDGKLLTKTILTKPIRCLALNSDGRRLAIALENGCMGIWHEEAGQVLALAGRETPLPNPDKDTGIHEDVTPEANTKSEDNSENNKTAESSASSDAKQKLGVVATCAFSTCDRYLVAGDEEGNVTAWDVATHRKRMNGNYSDSPITSISFVQGNRTVIVGHRSGKVGRWSYVWGEFQKTFVGHEAPITRIIVSPDKQTYATLGKDRRVKIWGVYDDVPLATIDRHDDEIIDIAFSKRGLLTSVDSDGTLRVTDIDQQRLLETRQLPNKHPLRISRNGEGVLIVGQDGKSQNYWSPSFNVGSAPDPLRKLRLLKSIAAHKFRCGFVKYSPDGRHLYSVGDDCTAVIWDAASGDELLRIGEVNLRGNPATVLAVSPDRRVLATGTEGREVQLWDLQDGKKLAEFQEHPGRIRSLNWIDQRRLVVGHSHQGYCVLKFSEDLQRAQSIAHVPYDTNVIRAYIHPQSKQLLSSDQEGNLTAWDTLSWDAQWNQNIISETKSRIRPKVTQMELSRSGKYLATVGGDRVNRLFDYETLELIGQSRVHTHIVACVAVSPDDKWVVTGCRRGQLLLYRLDGFKPVATIDCGDTIRHIDFSPDSQSFASADHWGKVKIWSVHDITD